MYADITIKAHCPDPAAVQTILLEHQAAYKGVATQTDTLYKVENSTLLLREGSLENVLVHYNRKQYKGMVSREVLLYLRNPSSTAVEELYGHVEMLAQAKMHRKIFFIDNIRFHLDQVEDLGAFVEIEAIDLDGSLGLEQLMEDCSYYKDLLQIEENDLTNDLYYTL